MRKLLESAAEAAIQYLEKVEARKVAPAAEAVDNLDLFREALPETTAAPEKVLKILHDHGSPATMAMAGPRFFGFVIGGALPVSLAANWLAAAWDQNSALYQVTPATAVLEEVALGWLVDLFKLPRETGGAFVTGATVANFTALAAARHAVLERSDWNVEADGLFGAPPVTVVVSEESHPTLFKSLGMLGFGRSRVVKVAVDRQGRMRTDALPPSPARRSSVPRPAMSIPALSIRSAISAPASSKTALATAAARCGRGKRRCGSVSHPGQQPKRMWRKV